VTRVSVTSRNKAQTPPAFEEKGDKEVGKC
jgi:hypothetical protein